MSIFIIRDECTYRFEMNRFDWAFLKRAIRTHPLHWVIA